MSSAGDFLQTMARASQERVLAARAKLSENGVLKQAQATAAAAAAAARHGRL